MMIRCEYCQQKNDGGRADCLFCGAPLPDEVQAWINPSPYMGTEVAVHFGHPPMFEGTAVYQPLINFGIALNEAGETFGRFAETYSRRSRA